MPHSLKVRCNGADKHVNEVDLDSLQAGVIITRFKGKLPQLTTELQERYVLRCKHCSAEVIVTRQMIEDFRRRSRERK